MTEILIPLLNGVPMTLALTAVAFAIGAILGMPICAARVSRFAVVQLISGSVILAIRAIPPLVWLFLIFYGIGSGYIQLSAFWAAAVGLGLITAVNMAEIYRGSLSAIHRGQWEASTALGMPRWSVLYEIIAPQLVRISLPASATYAVGLLKDTAVASAIGVTELAYQAYHVSQQTFRGLSVYAVVGVLYIVMSVPIALFSRKIDSNLRARVAR